MAASGASNAEVDSTLTAPVVPMALQFLQVGSGDIGGGFIGVMLQQGDGLLHDCPVFAVQHGHEPELTARSLWFGCYPAACEGLLAELQCSGVALISALMAAKDLARELIQQQYQGQGLFRLLFPVAKPSVEGHLYEDTKPFIDQGIKGITLAEPLPGTTVLKPELKDSSS